MKKIIIPFILLLMGFHIHAQEFDVRDFKADPSDISARRYEKLTVNDEPAAIIKIMTNIRGLIVESPQGIVDVEVREEGYWVWVVPRERSIRLMAEGYLPLDVNLPEPARSHMVYQMILTAKGTMPQMADLVRVAFRMNQSNVYIRRGNQAPVSSVGNIAVFNLERGSHSFRFIKDGFDEKTLTLDVGDDVEIDVELMPGRVTTPFEPPGIIVVTSQQPGAEIYLNEQRVGVVPYQNTHISGKYSLLLRHPDYHDHYQEFSLEAGATMTIPTISLLPRFGFYEVTSTPSGADVLLNNSLVGRTPLTKTQISSEHHELTLRYSMYHDHKETFSIEDGEHKRFTIDLKPAFGGLRITSEPSGARVFIAGREVGTTPYVNMQHPSGRHNVRLSLELYGDATETIVVNDGETTERFIPLAQNFGSLRVQAQNAEIYIDGRRIGTGNQLVNLTPGRYEVKAVRPQHHDDKREVFILLAQEENITLAPRPKTGYLSLTSEPFEAIGAEIWIDGVRQAQVTPAVIPLLEGRYEVRLKKTGFADAAEQVVVKEAETTQKTIRLHAGMEVMIASKPNGADLYINDEHMGETPKRIYFSPGNYLVELKKESYISRKKLIRTKSNPNKTRSLTLRPLAQMGLGYVNGMGGHGGELLFRAKMELILSFFGGFDPFVDLGFSQVGSFAFSGVLGYRVPYPIDFSFHAGWGMVDFYDQNELEQGIRINSFVVGSTLPIYLSPNFGFFTKANYWMNSHKNSLFFSLGILWAR